MQFWPAHDTHGRSQRHWYGCKILGLVAVMPILRQLNRMVEAPNWGCNLLEMICCLSGTEYSLVNLERKSGGKRLLPVRHGTLFDSRFYRSCNLTCWEIRNGEVAYYVFWPEYVFSGIQCGWNDSWWRMKELTRHIEELKPLVKATLDENCDTALYTPKFHLLDNSVDDLERLASLDVFHASLVQKLAGT